MVTFKTRKDGRVFPVNATRGSRNTGTPPSQLMKKNQPLPKNVRDFLSDKISKNIREGKPRDQAVAIAFSQTRKKFPEQSERLKLPTRSPQIDDKKFRSFLIGLVGLAITIRILRELRK